MQLYNLEGQPMEVIPDGTPIPPGRWSTPQGGQQSGNGGWGTQVTPADPLHQILTTANNQAGGVNGPNTFTNLNQLTPQQINQATAPAATGKPTYSALMTRYRNEHPGAPAPSGDEFNAWVTTSGAAPQGWTNDDASQVYPNTGPQNYNQNQSGNQTGTFSSLGIQNSTANQLTGGTTQQSTTGTSQQNTTGTNAQQQNQQQTGGQNSTFSQLGTNTQNGTQTTGVNDTLGFGKLLQGQASEAGANDAQRQAFLRDVVQTGGTGFNSQVDQAVRNSLSGPGINGAGDSARARAAGYAGAQVARNNMGERLGAAQQLAGPTAVTNLAAAGTPYLGSTTSSSNTGTQGQSGSTNATNFSNLINNMTGQNTSSTTGSNTGTSTGATTGFSNLTQAGTELSSGTASGDSSQHASGLIPQAQSVSTGGGGCVLCTAGIELGLWKNLRILRRVIDYKLRNRRFKSASRGYFYLFTPVAHALLSRPRLAQVLEPLARMVVYEELRVSGRHLPLRKRAWLVHWAGHALCAVVGKFPVPGRVTNARIENIARRNNVWFSLP